MAQETDFQTKFTNYNRTKRLHGNFELKKADSNDKFYYRNFEPQQLESLCAAEIEGYQHKYSDMDVRVKPFDYSSNPPLPGYVVIQFKKSFHIIPVQSFIFHRDRSKKAYISQGEAEQIAVIDVITKK